MNKKRKVIHILMPILLTVISYIFGISFAFKIPLPKGGYSPVTYLMSFKLAFGVFAVSSIISAILYVGSKKKWRKQTKVSTIPV